MKIFGPLFVAFAPLLLAFSLGYGLGKLPEWELILLAVTAVFQQFVFWNSTDINAKERERNEP